MTVIKRFLQQAETALIDFAVIHGMDIRAEAKVTVAEKNEKAGKKIYITGKGRCNLTNL